ncbi:PREDICTED: ephrin type-A receptor 4-like [Amphimedon queenslandica]|uniref:Fibronectin type-III domain-containing protein n=1 Tax=Amphimedon queenslandica TaxID=400682 RepID=A0AAN0JWR0_AMPQE|nr:PREDICTED: ephrin type-A receptor 4-like [Amphimedon queenslandica]|eukprot:XP_019861358.1 PREDICTED: ephrin type-A receptor 4-like [Amphimedon queenslandica]
MVDDDDIDIQRLQFSNSTNGNTFINITGLNDMSCYIFGVRAYTDNGYGEWTVIANETLELPTDTVSDNGSNQEVAIGVSVALVLILLTGIIVVSLVLFIVYMRKSRSSVKMKPRSTAHKTD